MKRVENITLRFLRYTIFSDYVRRDISLKQFKVRGYLVFGDFSMQDGAQVGTVVIKCF